MRYAHIASKANAAQAANKKMWQCVVYLDYYFISISLVFIFISIRHNDRFPSLSQHICRLLSSPPSSPLVMCLHKNEIISILFFSFFFFCFVFDFQLVCRSFSTVHNKNFVQSDRYLCKFYYDFLSTLNA